MSPKAFAAAVGIVLLGIGLFLGLRGHELSGFSGERFSCGSAFSPDNTQAQSQDSRQSLYTAMTENRVSRDTKYVSACRDAVGSAVLPWVLVIGGALIAIGGFVIRKPSAPTPPAAPPPAAAA